MKSFHDIRTDVQNIIISNEYKAQLDERGLDVKHQRTQADKHLRAYTDAIRAKKFDQARKHYRKYFEHKQILAQRGYNQ